jgi:hypothetical protein
LRTVSVHFDDLISEIKSMLSLKDFFKLIYKMSNFQGGVALLHGAIEGQNFDLAKIIIFLKSIFNSKKKFHTMFFGKIANKFSRVIFQFFYNFSGLFFVNIQNYLQKIKNNKNITNHTIFFLNWHNYRF